MHEVHESIVMTSSMMPVDYLIGINHSNELLALACRWRGQFVRLARDEAMAMTI